MSMEMFCTWSDAQMSLSYFGKQQSCVKYSTEINCNNHGSSVAADPRIKQQTEKQNKSTGITVLECCWVNILKNLCINDSTTWWSSTIQCDCTKLKDRTVLRNRTRNTFNTEIQ